MNVRIDGDSGIDGDGDGGIDFRNGRAWPGFAWFCETVVKVANNSR
jgi:hypothetical protein